jgi:hypothetical protein
VLAPGIVVGYGRHVETKYKRAKTLFEDCDFRALEPLDAPAAKAKSLPFASPAT